MKLEEASEKETSRVTVSDAPINVSPRGGELGGGEGRITLGN